MGVPAAEVAAAALELAAEYEDSAGRRMAQTESASIADLDAVPASTPISS
jgi:hypothetical protein